MRESVLTIILLSISTLFLAGCANLRHKTFTTTVHVKGGRITFTDPASEQPTPTIVFGQFTSSAMTIPYGAKLKRTITTYQFWSAKPSYKEEVEIDASKVPPDVIKYVFKSFNKKEKK